MLRMKKYFGLDANMCLIEPYSLNYNNNSPVVFKMIVKCYFFSGTDGFPCEEANSQLTSNRPLKVEDYSL